ncbi:hypothetical protein Ciccas_010791 [Cichlidogyrus casuarinus]|uniref:BTB domain-containing protein n=1 Tax=Cichlidogyrus casuarinus TaxID=1844966 RepID=A0ABD2PTH4_9PLAT
MSFVLNQPTQPDVNFLFEGPELLGQEAARFEVKAHKAILAASSEYFVKIFAKMDEAQHTQALRLNAEKLEQELQQKKHQAANVKSANSSAKTPKSKGNTNTPPSPTADTAKQKKSASPKNRGSAKSAPKDKSNKSDLELSTDVEVYSNTDVILHNVSLQGFYRLLRYIYYDEIIFEDVPQTIHLAITAKKFGYMDLFTACTDYLSNNICIEQVLPILHFAMDFCQDALYSQATKEVINDTFHVLNRDEFLDVHIDVIEFLVEQDVLNISEVELYMALVRWARKQCQRKDVEKTPELLRAIISESLFKQIRFPTMDRYEFVTKVTETGLLTKEELNNLLRYFNTEHQFPSKFSYNVRLKPCLELHKYMREKQVREGDAEVVYYGDKRFDLRPGLDKRPRVKRKQSFLELYQKREILPPVKSGLIPFRTRTGSLPTRGRQELGPVSLVECNSTCQCNESCPNRLIQDSNFDIDSLYTFERAGGVGLGVKSSDPLAANQFVAVYLGEYITREEVESREMRNKELSGHNYVLQFGEHSDQRTIHETFIDAFFQEDPSQLHISARINHSCQPNLQIVPIRCNNLFPLIAFFTIQPVAPDTELCYSYCDGCQPGREQLSTQQCLCNSSNCLSYMPK